jgi:cell division protein FtsA
MSKNIGVLDIGSSSIKLVIFNIQDEEPEFLYYLKVPSKGVEKGTIVRGSAVRKILSNLMKKIHNLDAEISELYVLVSHPKTRFQNEKLTYEPEKKGLIPPEETYEELEDKNLIEIEPYHLEVLKEEAAKKAKDKDSTIIHLIPRYFLLDGDKYYEPIGLTTSKLEAEYHIIKIPKQVYLNIIRLLKTLGVKVNRIFFPPYVALHDLFDEEDIEKNILIVDLGHTTTGYSYFKEGAPLISGVIPKGGKQITELIADTFFLGFGDAENLKKQVGYISNLQGELASEEAKTISVTNKEGKLVTVKEAEVSYVIREGLLDIIESLLLQLYEKHKLNLEKDIDEIILIGGGANLKGIKEFFEEIKSELGVPWNIRLGFSKNIEIITPLFDENENEELNQKETEYKEELIQSPEFASLRGAAWFLTKLKIQNQTFPEEPNPLLLEEAKEKVNFEEAVSFENSTEGKNKQGFFGKIVHFIKKVFSED